MPLETDKLGASWHRLQSNLGTFTPNDCSCNAAIVAPKDIPNCIRVLNATALSTASVSLSRALNSSQSMVDSFCDVVDVRSAHSNCG